MMINPGAFVQGMQAGQTAQLNRDKNTRANETIQMEQEKLKMYKQTHAKSMHAADQMATKQDQEIADNKQKLDAYKKLLANQERVKGRNIIGKWNEKGDAQDNLDRLNELSLVSGKGTIEFANDEQMNSYLNQTGYENEYILTEDGKDKVISFDEFKKLIATDPDKAREVSDRATAKRNEIIEGMKPYTVVGTDGKTVVGIHDIAPMIGAPIPKAMEDILAKKAGVFIKRPTATAGRKPTYTEERIDLLKTTLGNKGLKEDTEEYNKAYAKGLEEIKTQQNAGASQNALALETEAITNGQSLYQVYKNEEQIDANTSYQLHHAENMSKIKDTKEYKTITGQANANRSVSKEANTIIKELDSHIKNNTMYKGPAENAVASMVAMFESNKDGTWTKEMQNKVMSTYGTGTKIGMLVQSYVKSISGAAVTDAEREFLTKTLVGGDWTDPRVVRKKLESFKSVIDARQQTNIDTLGEMGAGGTAMNFKSAMHRNATGGNNSPKVEQVVKEEDKSKIADSVSRVTTSAYDKAQEKLKKNQEFIKNHKKGTSTTQQPAVTKKPANVFATK